MYPVKSTTKGSGIERMTNDGGVAVESGRHPQWGNISSTTPACGETRRKHNGRQVERRWVGNQADADMYISLS